MTIDELLSVSPYSLDKEEKSKVLTERLGELTQLHYNACAEYTKILDSLNFDAEKIVSYKDVPFLPVRLFKELSLKSVDDSEIVKTMTSSGTTGQKTSKIYLDKNTSANQQKAMVKIVNDFTGSSRMPMIIIDCPSVIKDRTMFSARGAGILGFSIFGSKRIYALDDNMKLDVEQLKTFLETNKGQTILLFGFTFMVWQYFYKELVRLKNEGVEFDLSDAVLIHGGGWKKLISESVSSKEFHDRLKSVCGISRVHDYYGMVEQTGCIYMECECGHLHASVFSDVVARRAEDFSECKFGEPGILQTISSLPESYPGHSLLTEDEGVILGEDDCPCGRKGKYFKILGRVKNAEIRGCSDTFAANVQKENTVTPSEKEMVLDEITYLVGDASLVSKMPQIPPKKPFDDEIISFLEEISRRLLTDKMAKQFPDVVTLGFWLRKASLAALKDRFTSGKEGTLIGRGVAFHIAPSNVAVNFAYSLFSGLICGNANIVRVPSKQFPQVDIICDAIRKSLENHVEISSYVVLVRYEREKRINDVLSSMSDVRVIWGGDRTVEELRQSPIGARTVEITFADRYSLAIIDSEYYLNRANDENEKRKLAMNFYNDTYLSDQNACTSPRIIVWMGDAVEKAKEVFWEELYKLVKEKYYFQKIQGVDKLSLKYIAAADCEEKLVFVPVQDNSLVRIQVSDAAKELMKYRGNSGYFYEFSCNDILSIKDFCDDTRCQTVVLCGEEDLLTPLIDTGIRGIDRVAGFGHSMDFDLLWDGYNLVEQMTRSISYAHIS